MNYEPINFDDVDLRPEELEVLKRMRDIVASKGYDYVYRAEERAKCIDPESSAIDCVYFEYIENGAEVQKVPSCVVGHLIADLNLEEFIDGELEGVGPETIFEALAVQDSIAEEIHQNTEVICALGRAQQVQDKGETWGKALQEFETTLHNGIQAREVREARETVNA